MTRTTLLLGVALLAAGCGGTEHFEPNAFVGSGTVASGGWLRVRNLNGRIVVDSIGGTEFKVTASKRWRRGGGRVRFVQRADGNDVVICTMMGDGGDCGATDYRTRGGSGKVFGLFGDGDVDVSYVVQVPAGVKVDVSTVNGSLLVGGTTAAVRARTVNGSVSVAAHTAPITAESVNGSIKASLASAADSGAIQLQTVNGSISAELPAALQGALDVKTVNGKLASEFPIPANTTNPRHLVGTIGSGGREVRLHTVNGSVTLTKRG